MHRRIAPRACARAWSAGLILAFTLDTGCAPALSDQSGGEPPKAAAAKHRNRLAKETSPYLLLHASNPVDWYAWGPEAFAKAKAEDKPIFLSVGYSSCYWCHVMERECFSDEAIARLMNEHFVCVKVDREERPDVDQVYMTALQAFGNGGGWPMSMFLTPDGRPFFGGTYFPPKNKDGHEGFPSLLERVSDAWRDHRAALERDADRLAEIVRKATSTAASLRKVPLSRALADEGRSQLADQFDPVYGGFGYASEQPQRPKFPEPSNLILLLDQHRRAAGTEAKGHEPLSMVQKTLDHMARGGIRDQLAGGYHRYSTERTWTVPHFEKMLYDNAQLATVYLETFEATGQERWRREAEAIFAFIERSMTAPEGGFFSALDAETDGEEGQYYVWTRDEVRQVLTTDDDSKVLARVYGLDHDPNFAGNRYVLFEPRPRSEQAKALGMTAEALEARLAPLRARLLAVRDKRPAPLRDDKVLTSWNGLAIAAYAEGYRVLKDERYRRAAEKAADFLWAKLRTPDGRLLRTYRAGQAKLPAYLEDYAFFAHGLLRLHAATGDPKHLEQARALVDRMLADFADPNDGSFFYTSDDHESLLARPKDPYDTALPSGNSVAIRNLIALAAATGEPRYLDHAGRALNTFSPMLASSPVAVPLMLVALEEYLDARPAADKGPLPVQRAVEPAGSASVVTAQAALKDPAAAVAPGREVEVALTLTVKEGWHIYANPASSENLIPTNLTLSSQEGYALSRVEYPRGESKVLASSGTDEVSVYEGKVTLTAHVRVAENARAGRGTLSFKVRFQACNDRVCLAPATLTVPLELPPGSR